MSSKNRFSWMIRPKGFISLLGGEYELIQKAGSKVLLKFYIASFCIVLISLFTFFSVRYAMNLLFNKTMIEIGLSVFISLLFLLMYIFIINTFSQRINTGTVFTLSNVTRVGFIIFMAFIISKPAEVYLYRDKIKPDVQAHKQDLIASHQTKINELFRSDIDKLNAEKQHYIQLNRWNDFAAEIALLSGQVHILEQKKTTLIVTSESRINAGMYFLYQVQTVAGKYFLSWVLSLLFILFFLLPGYVIYSISTNNEYYTLKSQQEKNIIRNAYTAFSKKYNTLFRRFDMEISFYTKFEDPPFNKIPKKLPGHRSSADFHNKYGVQ